MVNADTMVSTDNFNVQFPEGDSLNIQDLTSGVLVTFEAASNDWNASCSLATTDAGGTMLVTPTNAGTLYVTANFANVSIKFNGVETMGSAFPYALGNPFTVTWAILSSGGAPRLPTLHVTDLWQYLLEGDLLGFFQALFLYSFNSADLFYGVLAMVFCIPIYIRTKSLLFLCIIWIILGSFFVTLMPIVSGLAVLFMALGIGGVIFKLIRSRTT